ncbi:PREDICTED: uncharacterized protein LOC107352628 isoform X1 [Acropora digitifera]|uniref:uncharacterized protein LOC107352628 isoform X1 n=1 Tax=Acropora digitifera TaxID=70779 RepID=UPI00077B0EB3|nr:PREDICTED: uncharacterized protein LOC107352628 isoform X1 [Acropora digitifera]
MHNVSVMKLIHLEIEFISRLVCLNQHHSYQVLRRLYHINLILVFLFLFFWVMLTSSYHRKRGNQWLVEMTKSMKIKIKENLPNCRWGVWANNFLVMKKHHRMVLVFDRTPPLYR